VLFASENDPQYAQDGFYAHGKYPVEFDVLFPEEGTPTGFGYIAIMKSPQLYIDKMSQVILENTMMSAKVRYFVKKNAAIDIDQFLDWSEPVVEYEGDVNNIQPLQVQQVGGNTLNVLQMKIDELKETSSNRDVNSGGTGGSVTSGAAIAALQESGNKNSRDMIAASYRSFTQECYLAIELIRQFYDEMRCFRITGNMGQNEYIQFSNASIQPQPIPPAYPGQELEPDYVQASRKPIFDVVVKAQKRSPYSKLSQNELAKELYGMGFFNPQLADQSLAALDLMEFDGIESVREKVQQGQTLMNQLMMMQEQMNKLGMIVYQLTGNDVVGLSQGGVQMPQGAVQPVRGIHTNKSEGLARAHEEGKKATQTSYGERLAARARPDMEAQR
jgi:hypothetical protein